MKFVDAHVHINFESYQDELDFVIKKVSKEMKWVWNISWDLKCSNEVLKISKKNVNIKPFIGIHPNHSVELKDNWLFELEELVIKNKTILLGIGEIGLDYFRNINTKEKQKSVFIDQLNLARKYKLPIIIHTRDSIDDTIEILMNYKDLKILVHSWSGDAKQTQFVLKNFDNCYFSFNGIITFKNAINIRESFNLIPKEKIILETDCPWLTPEPERGKKNYPWKVENIFKYVSDIWNLSLEKTFEIISTNSENFIK